MAKKKVVRRYTEEQMVTLLENIVKRVKKEELLEGTRKETKASLSEDFKNSERRKRPANLKPSANRPSSNRTTSSRRKRS